MPARSLSALRLHPEQHLDLEEGIVLQKLDAELPGVGSALDLLRERRPLLLLAEESEPGLRWGRRC